MWDTLLNSASLTEFVGLFISTTAYRLTLKCHCYSSLALWETIKNTPLNPIYKLSARLCVHGKLHWVVQHIKVAELHHLTMWLKSISILSEVFCKCSTCSQWANMGMHVMQFLSKNMPPSGTRLKQKRYSSVYKKQSSLCLLLFQKHCRACKHSRDGPYLFHHSFFSFFFFHQSVFWNGVVQFPYQLWCTKKDREINFK